MNVCPGSGRIPRLFLRAVDGRLVAATCTECGQQVPVAPNDAGVVRFDLHDETLVVS